MDEQRAAEILDILELQNTIIENQRIIIAELMAKMSQRSDFELNDLLQRQIREVNKSIELLNGGSYN